MPYLPMDQVIYPPVVAAWGGGVNSTAMLIEWLRRGDRLDLVLFADTRGEKPATYEYRDTFAAWLKLNSDAPFLTVVANVRDESLEAECLRSKTLPSLAYGFKRCSQKWKRQPQDVYVNNWLPAQTAWARNERVTKLIGYDAGESRRAIKGGSEDKKYNYRYPLIEWNMDRKDCVAAIVAAGLAVPPKSSCFFCPASKLNEIINLRHDHPDLADRALAIEANAETNTIAGLGRNFAWKDVMEVDRRQGQMFVPPEISCDCYDESED